MFPWIPFLSPRGGRKLSDIEYLAIKEFGSKLVENTDVQNDGGTGMCATLTAASGKDLYLASAKVSIRFDTASTIIVGEITLLQNSTVVDRFYFSGSADGGQGGTTGELQHEFTWKGGKVAATEKFEIDVVASNADFDIQGTLVGIQEATGESPAIV